ncbi:hypothetical protein ES707_13558 [subsurface metagenome]
MEYAVCLLGWRFFLGVAHPRQPKSNPDLKLPTADEIKAMVKECYRRFREALKRERAV